MPALDPLVVIPCIPGKLHTEAVAAAVEAGFPVRVVVHDPADHLSYAGVLRDLWARPGEWVMVEQDVIPPAGALAGMLGCRHEWCTLLHFIGSHWDTRTLGVARFSLPLRLRMPALIEGAVSSWPQHRSPSWPLPLDTQLARLLGIAGVEPHVHPGRTRHLHRYDVESL